MTDPHEVRATQHISDHILVPMPGGALRTHCRALDCLQVWPCATERRRQAASVRTQGGEPRRGLWFAPLLLGSAVAIVVLAVIGCTWLAGLWS